MDDTELAALPTEAEARRKFIALLGSPLEGVDAAAAELGIGPSVVRELRRVLRKQMLADHAVALYSPTRPGGVKGVARELGEGLDLIRLLLKERGVTPGIGRRPYPEAVKDKIVADFKARKSGGIRATAAKFGCSYSFVYALLAEREVPTNPRGRSPRPGSAPQRSTRYPGEEHF